MKRNKKYNPNKINQMQYADLLSNTFFYHGSSMADIGARCGNSKYALTNALARNILERKNTWSGIVLAFCNNGDEQYTKMRTICYSTPIDRATLDARIEQEQLQLLNTLNSKVICSTGYFIVPDHTIDVEANREVVTQLFEQENPYNYTVTVLAHDIRQAKTLEIAA